MNWKTTIARTADIKGISALAVLFLTTIARGELPDVPHFATDITKNCGPVCVKYLDAYFGGTSEFLDVVRLCPPTEDGTSLSDLQSAAEKLGYETVPFRTNTSQLKLLRSPAILHQEFRRPKEIKQTEAQNHFIVLLGWDEQKSNFRVFDPTRGNIDLSTKEMKQLFSGVGLMVSDSSLPTAEQLFRPAIAWRKVTTMFVSAFGIVFVLFVAGPRLIAGRAKVLLLLLAGVGSLSQAGCQKAADTGVQLVDLGSHYSGDVINHVFKVFNPSDTPLTFLGKEST